MLRTAITVGLFALVASAGDAQVSDYSLLELSIAGIDPLTGTPGPDDLFILDTAWSVFPQLTLGLFPAPVDPSMPAPGTGGMSIYWSECQSAGVVARLTLLHFQPVENHQLEIRQKYPPVTSVWNAPAFARCDPPDFTPVRLTGSLYVLNPTVVAEPRSWSGVKSIFR